MPDNRDRNRPPHPARGVPPPARGRARARSCSSRSSAGGSAATRSSAAARGSCRSTRRSCSASRWSGTSATTRRPDSSRRCRCPTTGRTSRRAASSSPDVLVRFDHARGVAEVLVGERGRARGRSQAGSRRARTGTSGPLRRFPERDEQLRRIERAKEHIREGDVFQVVVSQRAERPTSASPLELYRALRRVNPSPYLFLLELDDIALVGSSPETVVEVRGLAREAQPDRGDDRAGRGRRRGAALVGEGSRRARDARRPRPQRPVARLRAGHGATSSASWRPSATRTSRISSPRWSASCATA